MEHFELDNLGFTPDKRVNYMLMQGRAMARMIGPEMSEEDWALRYSKVFQRLVRSDPEFTRLVIDGSGDSLDKIIARLQAETKPEMSAAA